LTPRRYEAVPGAEWVALGDEGFAAFSPESGETHLLNAECVEILERLRERGASSTADMVESLMADYDADWQQLAADIEANWRVLLDGGLVRPGVVGPSLPGP
jgi:PqqD family protein of HPr-rel-A system